MSELNVLLVAGTHGNEINAPWLMRKWKQNPGVLDTYGINTCFIEGNPGALENSKRYIDRDLNRSFSKKLLKSSLIKEKEVLRAEELLSLYGDRGVTPCQIAIDLHSTTSNMGSSLVVYGRRPADLAIASLIQAKLGILVYLHEGDNSQTGFLVESWPCGLVVEIGPVAQSLLDYRIVKQTHLVVQAFFEEISKVKSGQALFPDRLVIHKHLGSLDYPRDAQGMPKACLHPNIMNYNWRPISNGQPLFIDFDGSVISYDGDDSNIPVFINEAAYAEKGIALSLTRKEILYFSDDWEIDLKNLINQ